MKRIYHFYLTCMTLTLTMPMMIVSAFAVDDMWTVANNIIVDVYGKIVGVSTVLAGLMSAVAVIGAKLSNNQHKVDQAWDWLKRIWIAWAIINGIGAFIAYAYGRGEKYSLELGDDLSRALTSELAMLAAPETLPLFLRKYQRRQIKQYRRREPVYKGAGDIICCLDESGSTAGECAAWGKAVAMTLLEIAENEGRRFALIHFSGPGSFRTDVFLPKQFTAEDKLRAAETFLDGGTDFSAPLGEALRLIRDVGFNNADIVFITDGECILPPEHLSRLQEDQAEHRFTITGVLLDQGNAGMDFSLKAFCQTIYRTSELTGDAIVHEIVDVRGNFNTQLPIDSCVQ